MQHSQTHTFIGLLAETSLHPGAGSSSGAIDLPVQREAHTAWPCVFGSSLKGAMRARAEQEKCKASEAEQKRIQACIDKLYGPESTEHAGALLISDARMLLLPVRSLDKPFYWVTCREVLRRFKRDVERLEVKGFDFDLPQVDGEKILTCANKKEQIHYLNEYRFTSDEGGELENIQQTLAKLMAPSLDEAKGLLQQRLAIISDEMFSVLAKNSLPVNPHIAIKTETKTTKGGALWYEETLPPETLLYSTVTANRSRRKQPKHSEDESSEQTENANQEEKCLTDEEVMQAFLQTYQKRPWLQVGGNETVGMGWCALTSYPEPIPMQEASA